MQGYDVGVDVRAPGACLPVMDADCRGRPGYLLFRGGAADADPGGAAAAAAVVTGRGGDNCAAGK